MFKSQLFFLGGRISTTTFVSPPKKKKKNRNGGHLQLKVRINFGPIESPTKTIPLIDLVDNLRVVLAALPFVSQASKEKAIDAMSNTNFDAELPSAEVQETSFSWW